MRNGSKMGLNIAVCINEDYPIFSDSGSFNKENEH